MAPNNYKNKMEVISRTFNNRIYYGKNIKNDLEALFNKYKIKNTRVLLITGLESFDNSNYSEDFNSVCKKLKVITTERIRVSPNPIESSLKEKNKTLEKNFSWIICVGGGSVVDYGKLIKLNLHRNAKIFVFYTLPGSGSVVTPFAIYNNHEFKVGDYSEDIIPNIAYINEELIAELRSSLKLSATCDIFAHAFESLISKISNHESKKYSKTALNILLKNKANPKLIESRDIIIADLNAAKAESRALVLFPHAFGHYLTYKFKISHPIASIIIAKEFSKLLINNGFKINAEYISYLENLKNFLKIEGLYPEISYFEAGKAISLIKKYMNFVFENAPIKIDKSKYVDLVNSLNFK